MSRAIKFYHGYENLILENARVVLCKLWNSFLNTFFSFKSQSVKARFTVLPKICAKCANKRAFFS